MYWILALLAYAVLLAATLLFTAGCSKINDRIDRHAAELLRRCSRPERRAA